VATEKSSSGSASLITLPLPDLSQLAKRDPEFVPVEISKDEFEQVWLTRQFKAA
jgi:hypothetical protein